MQLIYSSIFGGTNPSWTAVVGSGTFSPSPNVIHPTYCPSTADTSNGYVILKLTAHGTAGCLSDSASGTIRIDFNPLPFAFAGPDATSCGDTTFHFHLTQSNAGHYLSLHWSAPDGMGQFKPSASTVHPFYYPSQSDVNQGFVHLMVSDSGELACSSAFASDVMKLVFDPIPTVNAGPDHTICAGETAQLTGDTAHATSVQWYSLIQGQAGFIPGNTVINPVYHPSAAEVTQGFATIILRATGAMTCTNDFRTDTVIISIHPLPSAHISGSTTICDGDSALITVTFPDGTPPRRFVYTDYIQSWSVSGIMGSSYQFYVSPAATSTYVLDSVSDALCSSVNVSGYATVVVIQRPIPFRMTPLQGWTYCQGGDGILLGLEGTEPGIFYQLKYAGTTVDYFTGDGLPKNFASVTLPGEYRVWASRIYAPGDSCHAWMADSIVVTVTPKLNVGFSASLTCQGDSTHFHIYGPDIYRIRHWKWVFGDGPDTLSYDTPHDTTHLYAMYGNYTVSLTISDTNGVCDTVIYHQISISPHPVSFFAYSYPTCQNQAILFTDLSYNINSNYNVKWKWNLGNGTIITVNWPNNPDFSYIYNAPGTYAVTLTVTNNDSCTNSYTHDVTIQPAPVPNFDYTTACANETTHFSDLSQSNGGGNIVTWSWNFDDPGSGVNNTSTDQNPSHLYVTGNTTYNVRLIVFTSNGCGDTIVKQVHIFSSPLVDFIFDTACLNQLIHYDANSGVTLIDSITGWSWNFGDGSAIVHNPVTTSHLYATAGTFITTLTVTDLHGCHSSISHTVIVNPLPVANFTWSSPVCLGSAVQFSDYSWVSSGYIQKWKWEFNDGSPAQIIVLPSSPDISHTFLGASLNHTVRLTVWTNDNCSSFIDKTVNSVPAPVANFTFSSVSCASLLTQFSDQSQPNGGGSIIGWNWNFGEPSSGSSNTSNLQNPSHYFAGAGFFNVTLIVTNVTGCTDTILKVVTVNQLPLANFQADTVCLGTLTQFTNQSVPNAASIISYSWDFGDATLFGTMPNPVHLYANPGIYYVKLTIINSNGCTKDTTKQVLVNPLPVAAYSYSTPNCVGASVCYLNLSTLPGGYFGSIVRWIWNFGDGTGDYNINFPASPNICHTFAGASTTHTVRLTVKSSDSCSAYVEHVVNSIPAPMANFSFTTNNCASHITHFTDLSQTNGGGNFISWNWNFGDPGSGWANTSAQQNPVHTFAVAGTYNVTLVVVNTTNCADTILKVVTVNLLPVADFTADTACQGTLTHFTDNSTPNAGTMVNYAWDFGDGNFGNGQNPTHQYASSGIFFVKLTVTNSNLCVKDTTLAVLVLPPPFAAFTNSTNNCDNDSVTFTDQSYTTLGYIYRWHWDYGDGHTDDFIIPAPQYVLHLYSGAGTYSVKLTVYTNDSCSDLTTHTVIVNSSPMANFSDAVVHCQNSPVQFTDMTQQNGGGAIITYNWDFGDPSSGVYNNSTDQNPLHTFDTAGIYQVRLIVTNIHTCKDTIIKSITIDHQPRAKFTTDTACLGSPTYFSDSSIAYQGTIMVRHWDFGDPASGTNDSSSLVNPSHVYSAYGTFNVTLTVTDSHSCQKDTMEQVLVNPAPSAMFEFGTACVHDSVTFTDLSIAPGSMVVGWHWNFGDSDTSNIQNPKHSYQNAGNFNVTLTVTNLQGCVDSITLPIVIYPKPTAQYIYSSYYCPKGRVDFQSQSDGNGVPIISWLWIFKPGYQSILPNPTFTFDTLDRTYPVTLIVTNENGCMDTITYDVFVKPGYILTFTYDTVCFGSFTQFHAINQASGDSLFVPVWHFDDPQSGQDNVSYEYNPVHRFTYTDTFYRVTLNSWDSDNCLDSTYRTVFVYKLPDPLFTFDTIPHCSDTNVLFKNLSLGMGAAIDTVKWFYGDGSTLVQTGTGIHDTIHHYPGWGNYHVKIVVINHRGCIDSTSHTVPVFCIRSQFIENDTLQLCARNRVAFNDSSAPVNLINSWRWYFGDTKTRMYTVFKDTIMHTYDTAGIYNVSLVVTSLVNGITISDSSIRIVRVRVNSKPDFLVSNNCFGLSTKFTNTSDSLGYHIDYYDWSFGDTIVRDSSGLQTIYHKYPTPKTYNVWLKIKNSLQCSDSVKKTVRIYHLPNAKFWVPEVCAGENLAVIDSSTSLDGAITKWHWGFDANNPDDTINTPSPVHIYHQEGVEHIYLKVTSLYGCSDTATRWDTIYRSPVSSFMVTDNVDGISGKILLNNNSVCDNTYYRWDFGNGQHSTDKSPIVKYSAEDSYTISLITRYGTLHKCYDTAFYVYVVVFKGLYIPNAFAPDSPSLNPDLKVFKAIGVDLKDYHIQVFDVWGHELWESSELDTIQGKPTKGWDGKYQGNPVASGTYVWKVTAVFKDGTSWQGSDIGNGIKETMGTVTLIR
ncbi:MAG: PKD domain-containing protein [Bacteroidetes bacterium]|nr:PKD domain-containing protein [Bacteroidota bacterium]